MQALLSYDKAPPFAAPLRFFITAPLFLALAGLLLAVAGGDLLAARWTPGALAATHLVTVGFMLQAMVGALIQVLPVVAGANLDQPLRVARRVHPGLTVGGLMLAGGFLIGDPAWLVGAAFVLGVTLLYFTAVTGRALLGVPSTSPTILGLKLAVVGLVAVVGLGAALAVALSQGWAWPLAALADLHAAWGLGGWAGVLLAAVAFVVVPMFQLTPGYPARPSWLFPAGLSALCAAWSVGTLADLGWLVRLAQGLMAAAGLVFALLTLRLQRQRRRARADVTYRYWQLGLGASIFGLFFLFSVAIVPSLADWPGMALSIGLLLTVGGFVPFIAGMLYKIMPFLAWLHLQNSGRPKVPPMNKLLPEAAAQRQWQAHGVAVALLLGAAIQPDWLARPAGLALAVAGLTLGWNLLATARRYRAHLTAPAPLPTAP